MDGEILKAIIQSHSEVRKELEDKKKLEQLLDDQKFPPTDRSILTALTKSFTDLIAHKVSPEAYQRYSVRIQLIEVLREWIRPCKELDRSLAFSQGERVLEFTARIAKIYLTNELLYRDDGNIEVLVNLAKALICLIPKRKGFVNDLERILERIGTLEQTEESKWLFARALEEKDSLELGPRAVENLYTVQRAKLVENPIVENFMENLKDSAVNREFTKSQGFDELLRITVNSPTIFHLSCSILKEIFVHCQYSPRVIEYINYYLKSLDSLCQENDKNILDLYPLRFQALIILLRIVPEFHTPRSRQHTIVTLVKIHESYPDETLILLTHFPRWLNLLTDSLTQESRLIIEESNRVTGICIDDERTVQW